MAQNDLIVVGIDVAKDKVDGVFAHWHSGRRSRAPAPGHRMLVDWLRKHSANKAVLEASGGYERDWTKVLRRQVPDGPAEQTASDEALTFTTNGRLSTTVAWIQHQAMRP